MEKAPTLYIVDGSGYTFRAFHAIRLLTTSEGTPTNAVYGFTSMLLKLLKDYEPDYLAVAFDMQAPTFRKEIYPEYKANRPPLPPELIPQFDLIQSVVKAFNIPLLEREGFEADDVIGTVVKQAREQEINSVIVSSDKDLMQLIGDGITMLDTMKEVAFDAGAVQKRFGVTPGQIADVLGLAGDSSDNIPGVPGIGLKTAAALLQEFGDLETLLASTDRVTGKKRRENLENFAEQARLSRKLATIVCDVPLDMSVSEMQVRPPDESAYTELFTRLEFHTLLSRMRSKPAVSRDGYRTILDHEGLTAILEEITEAKSFAVDLETTSKEPMLAEIVGISLCVHEGQAVYIPVCHSYLGCPEQLFREEVLAALKPFLEDPAYAKIGQNLKYEYVVFSHYGITLSGIGMDTMVASYLLDPGRQSHGLDEISRHYLGHQMITYKDVVGKGRYQKRFDEVEIDEATAYSGEDADVSLRLAGLLGPKLEENGLDGLNRDMEIPLIRVLSIMELNGVKVDANILGDLSQRFQREASAIEGRIHELAGRPFNINSPKQLQAILFEELGLEPIKKTKTGYSTDVGELARLALSHPLPAEVLEYRSITKLKSTYVDALPKLIHPRTGRIHTSYNQAVAATGRLSSSNPNLQNIPVRTPAGQEIRRAFVAEKGHILMGADYSQIELRILAHVSEDPKLVEAFTEGEDIHTRTAAEVFGAAPGEVTREQRQAAKTINFGILYGMSAFRLGHELSIPQKQAQEYIDSLFDRYCGVKVFVDRTLEEARKTQWVYTFLGRRRFLPDINARNHNRRMNAERIAVNTPIQGASADLIKLAMIRIQGKLERENLAARMILQVHDELVFEVPQEEGEVVAGLVKKEMENIINLAVPLRVDIHCGTNWGEAH